MSLSDSKKAQKELRNYRKEVENRRPRMLAAVMNTAEGREFIFDLIDRRCGVFGSSFTGDSKTFLREGMRKVGIDLMLELQEGLTSQYVMMINEAFSDKQREKLVVEAAKAIAQREENE